MKIYDKIVLMNIEDIKPYFNNPRNNEKTVQALIKIIPQVGFNVPLFIDKNNVIIKGHSRYNAAKILGIKQVPCMVSENSERQNNTDRVYDNAVQELSEWNTERLSLEIRELDFKVPEIDFKIDNVSAYVATSSEINGIFNSEVTESDMTKSRDNLDEESNREKKNFIAINCNKCGNEILISPEEVVKFGGKIK